jgi:hypothetical protein
MKHLISLYATIIKLMYICFFVLLFYGCNKDEAIIRLL